MGIFTKIINILNKNLHLKHPRSDALQLPKCQATSMRALPSKQNTPKNLQVTQTHKITKL